MSHTPGPWSVATPTYGANGVLYILAPQQSENEWPREVAVLYSGGEDEQDANARLIAAAPELLAALRIARETIAMACGTTAPFVKQAFAIIDPAIAKAEGVQ